MRVAALIAATTLAAVHAAGAQSLAERIAAVRTGTIRLQYAARSGICGDGRDVVRDGDMTYTLGSSPAEYRGAELPDCRFGPVRVELARDGGSTSRIRIHVGGGWDPATGLTDLGTVPAPEAARYFVAQARALDGRDASYALDAAIFADSVSLAPELDALARATDVRRGVRGAAIFALAALDEPDARRRTRALITDDRLEPDRRGEAIIALSRGGIARDDARFLRGIYASLDPSLRDRVFLAVSRSDDAETQQWLLDRVTDDAQPMKVRRQALFWAGQGSIPTAALAALYPRLNAPELREHYAFVLSQRPDSAAVDQLIAVAERDQDRAVRRRAMFWLGQSRSPRAESYLREVLSR